MGTFTPQTGRCPVHHQNTECLMHTAAEQKEIFGLHSDVFIFPPRWREYEKKILTLRDWILNYISKPNEKLGRPGKVCPFTGHSYKQGQFHFAIEEQTSMNLLESMAVMLMYKKQFQAINTGTAKEKVFNTIVVMFPNISSDEYQTIVDTQAELKATFVKDGMMIGQFYPGYEHPGLHNPDFRPLDSPIPLLVIRNMVKTDWPFLAGTPLYEQVYNSLFGVN